MFLDDCPDIKFGMKSFKPTLEESPELQQAFAKTCYSILSEYLSETKAAEVNNSSASANIINMFGQFANIVESA